MLGLAGWLLFSFSAAWVGSRYMPGEWYETLLKPSWNPPNAIFAPVWSVLYMLMGVAAWLVWRQAGFKGAAAALSVFAVQLALNALWTYLFFGMRRPDLAFFEIIFLWALIVLVIVLFRRINRAASFLMLPYVLWVGFAAYLNFVIWRLNTWQ